ncbi:MAG TPA: beta-ketoacyl synthase N-terminal-like domain-containing protein [Polyangiaceae bacterium]|nr:beta-ketoacyl synthase N-terminal-like domain-containing protein [Polyangiaceae bacterium]
MSGAHGDGPEGQGLDAVAVVGMAGRFPGAGDVDAFWQNLCAGVESIRFFSEAELLEAGVAPGLLADPAYVRANAALEGVELFDAAFFGLSPAVARITDPQQRLFLEVAWHALEHAGYDAARVAGDVGVFAGLSINTYLLENLASNRGAFEAQGLMQAATASRGDHIATLTAYKLGLRGPAFAVQSACSTALSAVHLACQALLACQCDVALAGASSVRVPQAAGYLFQPGGVASPDGHCRPFDARAAGTVFGSGVGCVVLKRLADALADGDTVHAVVRGSAANNDGAAKVGYAAPSPEGQRRAIAMALAVAGVRPDQIGYVECHGTGTALGDPVEIDALTRAFAAKTSRRQFCAVGSVKSNVGHLDTAAGIAGFIKAVLCLKHRALPATLHYEAPNPQIDFASGPFYVNRELRPWAPPPGGEPRRAGVSSFGIGGTNVHVVLEEGPAPPPPPAPPRPGWHVLALSARTASALEAQTDRLRDRLAAEPGLEVADVAYTLQLGRKAFAHRRVLLGRDRPGALDALERLPPGLASTDHFDGREPALAFVFPGAASAFAGMGRELYDALPGLREPLEACLRALGSAVGVEARATLLGAEAGAPLPTHLAEPALFALEVALARLLGRWGLRPRAVSGQGVGELAAACVSGVLSLDDAARLVAARARSLLAAPAGAMSAVMVPEAELRGLLDEHGLALAEVLRPSLCVVAGPAASLEALEARLEPRGVPFRRLGVDRALQSPALAEAMGELAAALARVELRDPEIAQLSSADGAWARPGELREPRYWAEQAARTLRLSEGFAALFGDPDRLVLEVGPGRALLNAARLHPARAPRHAVLAALSADGGAAAGLRALSAVLGRLWLHGAPVDWARYHEGERRRRVPLPGYPFERQRLWLDPPPPARAPSAEPEAPPRKARPADWLYVPSWRRAPPLPPPGPSGRGQDILLFADRFGLASLLAPALARRGHRVARVERDGAGPDGRELRGADDYRALLGRLADEGRFPQRVVHLWGVDPHRPGESRLDALAEIERATFASLSHLARAFGALRPGLPFALDVVASQLFQVLGDEAICPEKSLLLGPTAVVGQEYPGARARVIDVALPPPGGPGEARLVERLLAELEGEPGAPVVALRGPSRWARAFEPLARGADAPPVVAPRRHGTYLITGGLGGMGLVFAEHLARAYGAALVLVGRTPLPERSRWSELAASGDPSPAARAARQVLELERLGARVMPAAADVADAGRMREVLAEARARFGPLHGVIHAAGVAAGGALQRRADGASPPAFGPKVRGTIVLDELLAGEPLDFVALCSSRTAVLGGYGQADYVAANAFLDAFAHEKRGGSATNVVSIGWCGWRDVGMLANAARRAAAPPAHVVAPPPAGAPSQADPPPAGAPSRADPPPAGAPSRADPPPAAGAPSRADAVLGHPLLARRAEAAPGRDAYETPLRVETHWVLADHRILGNPVIAGTTYLEMVRAALEPRLRGAHLELSDIYFLTPLSVRPGDARVARLEIEPTAEGFSFQVESRRLGGEALPVKHVVGRARAVPAGEGARLDLAALLARCPRAKAFTDEDACDEDHGPRWQCVRRVHWGDGEIVAVLELPAEFAGDLDAMKIHPAMLDKAIGTGRDFLLGEVPYMPYSYGRLTVRRPFPRRLFVHTRARPGAAAGETPSFDLTLADDAGRAVAEIEAFSLKRVNDVGAVYKAFARRDVAPPSPRRDADTPPAGAASDRARSAADSPTRAAAPIAAPPAAERGAAASVFERLLRDEAISPSDGVEVLRLALAAGDVPHLVVSTRDLEALRSQGLAHTAPAAALGAAVTSPAAAALGAAMTSPAAEASSPPRAAQPRPALPAPYVAPETATQRALASIIAEALGLEAVGLDDDLFALGGDSVGAIQIAAQVRQRLGRDLAVASLFEAPTVRLLAATLGDDPVDAAPAAAAPADLRPGVADAAPPRERPDASAAPTDALDAAQPPAQGALDGPLDAPPPPAAPADPDDDGLDRGARRRARALAKRGSDRAPT